MKEEIDRTGSILKAGLHLGPDPSSKATLWLKAQHEGALPPRASSAKTRGFHTQLDEGPETP